MPGNGAFMLETRQYYYLYILLSTIIPVMLQFLHKDRRSRAKLGFIFGLTLLVTICFVLKAARPYIKWNIQLFCLSMTVLNDDYDIYI